MINGTGAENKYLLIYLFIGATVVAWSFKEDPSRITPTSVLSSLVDRIDCRSGL